jgi:tripartite-type tricarboxylate transporter receptor subunit TctC
MGVPAVWKYVKSEEARKVVDLVISQQVFQRSYVVPPGTPAEQVDTLRKAFDATMSDPQFLAEATKFRIDISALPGSTVQEVVQGLYAAPKEIVEQARRAINP